ncbi:hypothetical protein DL771_002168 [Monosporascus sp. 5C6A]|nr:hypothetical protein DL771_002168 [Monosporascus sp. 5C6A]
MLSWTSGSRSSSTFVSDSIVASQELAQQEYDQAAIQTSFGGFDQQLGSPTYPQTPIARSSQSRWRGGFTLEDRGDGGGLTGFGVSPVTGVSQSGSYDEAGSLGSLESGEVPGGAELKFGGTNGLANHASTSNRSKTGGTVVSNAREDSRSGLASSVSSTSDRAHRSKRGLRSVSRRLKNTQQQVEETPEERKSRNSHNLVEKQYRNRLNAQFETLLHSIPDDVRSSKRKDDDADLKGGDGGANVGEKCFSEAEVLAMARRRFGAV